MTYLQRALNGIALVLGGCCVGFYGGFHIFSMVTFLAQFN